MKRLPVPAAFFVFHDAANRSVVAAEVGAVQIIAAVEVVIDVVVLRRIEQANTFGRTRIRRTRIVGGVAATATDVVDTGVARQVAVARIWSRRRAAAWLIERAS